MIQQQEAIEDNVQMDLNYPSVTERYFSHHFFVPINEHKKKMVTREALCKNEDADEVEQLSHTMEISAHNGNDTCILMHSNGICVICISPKHPIVAEKKSVEKINFNIGNVNRLHNKVAGKGKRGAQILGLFSPLCELTCTDNSTYIIYSGVRGKLIEVNTRLIENPNLVATCPMGEGYLAIVLPKLYQSKDLKKILLSSDDYNKLYASY